MYVGGLYLALHAGVLLLMCVFTFAGGVYPGSMVFIVPALGVCSGYWIFRRKFSWWRNSIIAVSVILLLAIIFTAVYVAPKMDDLKHHKFLQQNDQLLKTQSGESESNE